MPVCEHLFDNERLRAQMRAMGYFNSANAMEVVHKAHEACNSDGLSDAERTRRLRRMRDLLCELFNERAIHDPYELKRNTAAGGVGQLLGMAWMGNIDTVTTPRCWLTHHI